MRRVAWCVAGLAGAAGLALADAVAPRSPDDTAGRQALEQVERNARAGHRMFAMDCDFENAGTRSRYRMLGLQRGERARTRIVYVIAAPAEFRGTALAIEDSLRATSRDRMWLAFPGLAIARELSGSSLKLLVPGTGITYGEARGWLEPQRFHLRTRPPRAGRVVVEAVPRTASTADEIGAARLVVEIDPRTRVVRRLESHDAAGNLVRTFEVLELARVAGRWLPGRARATHHLYPISATITYRYAALAAPPPAELFEVDPEDAGWLERVVRWAVRRGIPPEVADTLAREPARPPRR